MSWALLGVVTAVTVGSRLLPMALLPAPRGRAAVVLDRLPAPLFAGLAALALAGDGPPSLPAVAAVAGALLGAWRRSLGLTLAGGVAAHLVASAVS